MVKEILAVGGVLCFLILGTYAVTMGVLLDYDCKKKQPKQISQSLIIAPGYDSR